MYYLVVIEIEGESISQEALELNISPAMEMGVDIFIRIVDFSFVHT